MGRPTPGPLHPVGDVRAFRHGQGAPRLGHSPLFVDICGISHALVDLGVSLFIRQNRQIDLTPEGHRFKRYAERLIAEWRKARHDVSLGETGVQLAVGGTIRVWDAGMTEWVHDVHRSYPDLALILESHTPETLVRRLLDGQLDLSRSE